MFTWSFLTPVLNLMYLPSPGIDIVDIMRDNLMYLLLSEMVHKLTSFVTVLCGFAHLHGHF